MVCMYFWDHWGKEMSKEPPKYKGITKTVCLPG